MGLRRAPVPVALAMSAIALGYRTYFARCCLEDESIMRELPAFLDLFACGMLAAYGVTWARRNWLPSRENGALMTVATLAIAVAFYFLLQSCNAVQYVAPMPRGRDAWDVYGRTLFSVLTGAFIFCACFAGRPLRAAIANPVLVFLSLVSYNLYLWHTLVMIYMWKHGIPRAATANPHDDAHWKFAYIALGWSACIAVATAVTYFFERPLLSTLVPQSFAFDWRRLLPFSARREPPIATRKRARKRRAQAELGVGAHGSAVGFDDLLHDGKPEPRPRIFARARPVDHVKTLEDMR